MPHLDLSTTAPQRLAKLKAYATKYPKNHADWHDVFDARHVTHKSSAYNPPCAHYDNTHCRWVENVDRAGLRFVGYVKWLRDCHGGNYFNSSPALGWYIDSFQEDCLYPVVYRLPSRDGAQRFVYGYADPFNDGAAFLSFDYCDDEKDAQAWACSLAKAAAEDAREDDAKCQAENQIDDIGNELKEIRQTILALCLECKKACATLADAPTIRATIKAKIESALEERERLRDRRTELEGNHWAAVPF